MVKRNYCTLNNIIRHQPVLQLRPPRWRKKNLGNLHPALKSFLCRKSNHEFLCNVQSQKRVSQQMGIAQQRLAISDSSTYVMYRACSTRHLFSEFEGVEYKETFAKVVKFTTPCLFFAKRYHRECWNVLDECQSRISQQWVQWRHIYGPSRGIDILWLLWFSGQAVESNVRPQTVHTPIGCQD